MKKVIYALLLTTFLITTILSGVSFSLKTPIARASYDPNSLVSDAPFVNLEGISTGGIQNIFVSSGSFLANYSENGRSAAQIIYDAAHGYGDASGSMNGIVVNSSTGTINPVAILATLQKEQGLVTGAASTTLNQSALNAAMGYACPDGGGCNSNYSGFTKQIENAAWQLRYNYERASGHGFLDYQVGNTETIDGQSITYSNRATASLYRYTPHLGTNFTYYFDLWSSLYQYTHVSHSSYPTVARGGTVDLTLVVKNTGSATWTPDVVHLGTDRGRDRTPGFIRGYAWLTNNRVVMQETSAATGENATFHFTMSVPSTMGSGTYREYFRPVADGITWLNDQGIYWDITVP